MTLPAHPSCVIAVPNDPRCAPVLLNTTDPGALERTMAQLGYAPGDYTLGRAKLAHVALVEAWDREAFVDFTR